MALRRPVMLALALASASAGLSACWMTTADGDALQRRVRELEEGQQSQREELQAEVATAQTKVVALEEVLDRATKLVTRNSADTGAQVEQLQQQLMAVEGQLAELRNDLERRQTEAQAQQTAIQAQLSKIARAAGVDVAIDESDIPAGADEHFTEAERAFTQREYSRARGLFRAFIQRHGADQRVDDAQYRVGASYLEENRPATALGEFQRVIQDHRDGDMADDALLGMARAFYALHACGDARTTIQALIRAHPRSPLLTDARALLRTVTGAPRGYCTS